MAVRSSIDRQYRIQTIVETDGKFKHKISADEEVAMSLI